MLRGARIGWPDRPLVTHVGRWDRGKASESAYRNCRIREGQWSLVNAKNRPDAWELYDLAADPGEKTDVAQEHPDVVKHLAAEYDAWWQSVQPDLVNEDLDGPSENPFKDAFTRQFGPAATCADVPYGPPESEPTHRGNVGVKLKDRLDGLGVSCERVCPGAVEVRYAKVVDSPSDMLFKP